MALYEARWETGISQLLDAVHQENAPLQEAREKGLAFKRTDLEWFHFYAALYLRYLQAYRPLEDTLDQLVHPQKHALASQMLEAVLVRMVEVKQVMTKYATHSPFAQTDYLNLDQFLHQLQLTPKALQVPIPRVYAEANPQRAAAISSAVAETGACEEVEAIADGVTLDSDLSTAIRILQKLERGRQGIVRWLALSRFKAKSQRERPPDSTNEDDTRTLVIQKYWRAFLDREQLHVKRQEELRFLGFVKDPMAASLLETAEKQRARLKVLQRQRREQLAEDEPRLKEELKRMEEPALKQQMLDARRKWIKSHLEMHEFSSVPNKAAEFYKEEESREPPKEEAKGKKSELEKFLEEHVAVGPTAAVVRLQAHIKKYEEEWAARAAEDETYCAELSREALRPQIEKELEAFVDDLVNLELDAMRLKYGIKKKKDKKKKKKAKKARKVKLPQALAKKDPQQILEDLFEKNVAKLLSPAHFAEFEGEHNTVTHLVEKTAALLPDPSLFQLRNVISEQVGLPLSCSAVRLAMDRGNWNLFYGASGTGKTMMVRALQTETNALVFDLSPEGLRERFTEKSELTKLMWSVAICAQSFQPAVVVIDDVDSAFPGPKRKKEAGNFGAKLKKVLVDLKKNKLWDKNDRIAVVACTHRPFDGSIKEMRKVFDKKFYFPYPNYATRCLLIRSFLASKLGALPSFAVETLAQATEGFPAGSVRHATQLKRAIERVLTPSRITRLKDDPLRLSEFVPFLSSAPCVFYEEYDRFRKFTDEVLGLKDKR